MPKPIRFQFEAAQLAFQMQKVDRSKLYGFKEAVVHDMEDRTCELATLAEDGKTVVGKGGTGIGQLTADGKWTDKSKLTPVNLEGNEIQPVVSSFAAPIELAVQTTIDDYLDHNIRLVYRLVIDELSASEEKLVHQLKEGVVFKFPYSYRGGLEADVGFLLLNAASELFFLVGVPTVVDYVGLQQVAAPDETLDVEGGDLMDFGMM